MKIEISKEIDHMRMALFEPDIPQNTGAILRLAACFKVGVDIIEPCGFIFSKRQLRRSGMDYINNVEFKIHNSWAVFLENHQAQNNARIVLLSTKANCRYIDFNFEPNDILLLGRESAGVPESVHSEADAQITIPIARNARSLNIAVAASIVLGEATRQLDAYSN